MKLEIQMLLNSFIESNCTLRDMSSALEAIDDIPRYRALKEKYSESARLREGYQELEQEAIVELCEILDRYGMDYKVEELVTEHTPQESAKLI